MKKIALLIALLLVLMTLGLPSASGTAPVRILITGDSITQGKGGDYTWRYFLDKSLSTPHDFVGPLSAAHDGEYKDSNFDQDHAAYWGMMMWEVVDNQPPIEGRWSQNIGDMVTQYQPDIVVEHLGTNDILYGYSDPAHLIGKATEFVLQVQAAKPDTDIVLSQLSITWLADFAEYNSMLVALESMSTQHSRVVVTSMPVSTPEEDVYDGVHPTVSGEVKIAQSVSNALVRLGLNTSAPVVTQPETAPPVLTVKKKKRAVVLKWTESTVTGWKKFKNRPWKQFAVDGHRIKIKTPKTGTYRFKVATPTTTSNVIKVKMKK